MPLPANAAFKSEDTQLWDTYRKTHSPASRDALLRRFDGVIQSQVNRWAGSIPRSVLLSEAKLLALKAFDSYNPNAGAALATHVVNNLQPISRYVYTYQNTARIPENVAMRLQTYNSAVEHLKAFHGRQPTTDELHNELGWSAQEISRIRDYNRKDLVESGPTVDGDFYTNKDDDSDLILAGIYAELLPSEKELFEYITGFNGRPQLSNAQLLEKLGITQAQLSYKKTLLTQKIKAIQKRHGL